MKKFKVALVHDDLVQWGGAERVLAKIAKLLPGAEIYTSVLDYKNQNILKNFDVEKIHVSFMQKIPFWKKLYRSLVFLYPLAFESFDFQGFDLVISQTTRFAKNIITGDGTTHVCYCHTPPRFLWGLSNQQPMSKWLLPLLSFGRLVDQASALRVDYWLAGSKNCQKRLKKIYKVDSKVLYPFVENKFFKKMKIQNKRYFLVIARLIGYKKIDEVIKAANMLGVRLVVVGSGPERNKLAKLGGRNIEFVKNISDDKLIDLIANCQGVVVSAEEDFGLVSIEAQAMGKGIIAYRAGGSMESVLEGVTGVFFAQQNAVEIAKALKAFNLLKILPSKTRRNARRFSESRFRKQFIDTLAKFGYSFS